jgi:hypothetical protein
VALDNGSHRHVRRIGCTHLNPRLWRPSACCVAGNRPNTQPACAAAPGRATGTGGKRVSGTPDSPTTFVLHGSPCDYSVERRCIPDASGRPTVLCRMHGTRDQGAQRGGCTAGHEEPREPSRLSRRGSGLHQLRADHAHDPHPVDGGCELCRGRRRGGLGGSRDNVVVYCLAYAEELALHRPRRRGHHPRCDASL